MGFRFGIENLLSDSKALSLLKGHRVALLAHPASVFSDASHSIDHLFASGIKLSSAFGPQHGMRGEKQDNMIESDDFVDPLYKIPVFSLYGQVRRPTPQMMDTFDIILVDLQDVGCRIYTFLTTLFYVMDEAAKRQKAVWVLDRPNPAGRPVEGNKLNMKFESFVGAAPVPMRHGLTLGEAALWYKAHKKLDLELKVIPMLGYEPNQGPGYGWNEQQMIWVNPSPNMPRLTTARAYAGTVLLEGTKISEGRGTTRPLENFGSPLIESDKVLKHMHKKYSPCLKGCVVRVGFYEPTFHKFKGQLVSALQIHCDDLVYSPNEFKPYRLVACYLKSVRELYSDYDLWLSPPYEYETKKMPIDILSGDDRLRLWVDDSNASLGDLEAILQSDENAWKNESEAFLLYK